MTETAILKHCEPVRIYPPPPTPPGPPAKDVDVNVTGAGAPGDGIVKVHQDAADGPVAGDVPTGAQGGCNCLGTQEVWLHYVKTPDGPDEIEVEYEVKD